MRMHLYSMCVYVYIRKGRSARPIGAHLRKWPTESEGAARARTDMGSSDDAATFGARAVPQPSNNAIGVHTTSGRQGKGLSHARRQRTCAGSGAKRGRCEAPRRLANFKRDTTCFDASRPLRCRRIRHNSVSRPGLLDNLTSWPCGTNGCKRDCGLCRTSAVRGEAEQQP